MSKTDEGGEVDCPPASLSEELAQHYAETAYKGDDNFVFAHPQRGSRLEAAWYRDEFNAALKAAGITDYIRPFHDAGHGALTNLAATSASKVALMTIAGHRSCASFGRSAHPLA